MEPILRDVPMELHSARLLMRIPRPGDGKLINPAVVESVKELAPWMPWATPTPTLDNTEEWCRRNIGKFWLREQIHYTLWLKDSMTYVGGCGMNRIDWKIPMAEIGYWLATPHCGNGLMTEAVNALTAMAHNELGIQRMEIRCDDRNLPSARVAERAGYTLEGTLRCDAREFEDRLRDTRIYAKISVP
jgi:RimJ/RimL family protein N-acetyltransferase